MVKIDFCECKEIKTDRFIPCEQHNKKITFKNNNFNKISKIDIECYYKKRKFDNVKHCDYLVIDLNKIQYFVELKDKGISKPLEQLWNTIIEINNELNKNPKLGKKYSFIICTSCPMSTISIQNFKNKYKDRFNSILIVEEHFYQHTLIE